MEKSNVDVRFTIVDVARVESHLSQKAQAFVGKKDFHFEIKLSGNVNPELKNIGLSVTVEIWDKPKEQQLGFLKTGVTFHLVNFEEVITVTEEGQVAELPNMINEVFISIAISTTRGVMAEHFRGTGLHSAILPALDPKVFASPRKESEEVKK